MENRVTFVDPASGLTLGSAVLLDGFKPVGGMTGQSSKAYPVTALCSAYNLDGTVIVYTSGEGFTDRSKCPMLSGMYSGEVNRISKVDFRNFQDAGTYADEFMRQYASNGKATALRYIEERAYPVAGFDREAGLNVYKQQVAFSWEREAPGIGVNSLGYYYQPVCRIYEMDVNGITFKVAMATLVRGAKYKVAMIPGMPSVDLSGIGKAVGDAFGGVMNGMSGNPDVTDMLFGNSIIGKAIKKKRGEQAPAGQPAAQNRAASQVQNGAVEIEVELDDTTHPFFGDMPLNAIIDWDSYGVFILQTKPELFEEAFANEYACFCSTYQVSPEFSRRIFDMQGTILQNIANYTQQNIQQQQQSFAAWQRINQAQQAAFDSYNQAWWDRTNAHDAAFRQQSQQAFNQSSPADKFSEAIRGVNTYVREDGSETQVSVDYDRAFTNSTGETFGTNSTQETFEGWTEMKRKN